MKEFWNNLIESFTSKGVSETLAIVYIIVSMLLIVMAVVALVMRIIVMIKYADGNNTKTKSSKTSFEVAREALNKAGLSHIQVKRSGFFRATFFGNSYSLSQKTIYLRRGLADKDSITAVSMALQKVAIAKMCEDGNGMTKTRNVMQILNVFAPIMFVPIILLGFLIDFIVFQTVGAFSIVGIVVGLFLILTGLIATILSLPVEKKANTMAFNIIQKTEVLNEEEQQVAKKVFSAYMVAYICEFIVAIIKAVQIVLEIVINAQINKNSK